MATQNKSAAETSSQKELQIKSLQDQLKRAKDIRDEWRKELQKSIITFLTTAFGVVAALFWQTAITDSIKSFIPVTGAWAYEIFVALLVTGIAVTAIFFISRIGKKLIN